MFDTVLREEFTMLITRYPIIIVMRSVAIGLLDATARGRIITSNGETDHRVIAKLHRLLNQTFTEGTATNNSTAVVILNGTCENL